MGSTVLGSGFVLNSREATEIIERSAKNRDVLFPYLIGADINSDPLSRPSRWVINFHDWPLEKAETYPDCIEIVRTKVKPERDANTYSQSAKERWWLYERSRPELYSAISEHKRVLVIALTSNTLAFTFLRCV